MLKIKRGVPNKRARKPLRGKGGLAATRMSLDNRGSPMPPAPIPEDEAQRLSTLHGYGILDTSPERAYDDLTLLASFICEVPISLISLVDKDRQWFKSRVGLGSAETSRSESFCAHTLSEAKTLIVEDTLLDPRFVTNPLVTGEPGIRFYAGAPLVTGAGHVLGTMCVIDTKPGKLSQKQKEALEALSRQAMALVESGARLKEKEKAVGALIQSEKLAAVGRVASSIAHAINNPLEAVTNLVYLSQRRNLDPDIRAWLIQAEQELRRASSIASQTLRFHKQSTKPRPTTCQQLFSTTLSLHEARLSNARIRVEHRERACRPVICFEGDVCQALSNIVSNAIDAMPNGGRLLIRSREGTDWGSGRDGVVLTLADTGTGIDPDIQKQMFEAFFTTKGIGGSGLGLWISTEIMRRHGGHISIRSTNAAAKSGTVVNLFLPFDAGDQPA
jgi:signal transduction histidine kinase